MQAGVPPFVVDAPPSLAAERSPLERLRADVAHTVLIRRLTLLGYLAAIPPLRLLGVPLSDPVLVTLLVWLASTFGFLALVYRQPTERRTQIVHTAYLTCELALMLFVVHHIGTAAWVGVFFPIFTIYYACTLLPWRGAVLISTLTALGFCALALAEANGWLPHRPLFERHATDFQDPAYLLGTLLLSAIGGYGLLALTFGHFGRIQRQTADAERASHARYRIVSELTSDFAWAFRVQPGGALQCEWITDAVSRITGYSADELARADVRDGLVHPDDREAAQRWWQTLLAGQDAVGEMRVLRKDGGVRWLRASARPQQDGPNGPVIRIHGAAQDVTEHKRWEETLEHHAMHDPVTGLPNRTLLRDRLDQTFLAAQREGEPFAVLVLGLNRFKQINESLGYHAGDRLLQQVGQRLRRVLRASDTVARLGGDEFTLLLPTTSLEGATLAAGKVLRALEHPFLVDEHRLEVSAGIGVAVFPEHGEDAQVLLRRADAAMYAAKRVDDGFMVYQPGHEPQRPELVADLRHALDSEQLLLHFQPKIYLGTGQMAGVEALVRWQHPKLGLIPPDRFIPLAESTGLIKPLSRWVLNAALEQHTSWRTHGYDVPMYVNLSMRDLHDADLPHSLSGSLLAWGVSACSLGVEVTETAVMSDPERAMQVLGQIRGLGAQVAIDDFGTGYSSLSYLRRIQANQLKIDRSFVQAMATEDNAATIVRATVDLGHALGLEVVAEGVEDAATRDRLTHMGCDAAQGYFFSHPLTGANLQAWLARGAALAPA